jgi:hypothetical protein
MGKAAPRPYHSKFKRNWIVGLAPISPFRFARRPKPQTARFHDFFDSPHPLLRQVLRGVTLDPRSSHTTRSGFLLLALVFSHSFQPHHFHIVVVGRRGSSPPEIRAACSCSPTTTTTAAVAPCASVFAAAVGEAAPHRLTAALTDGLSPLSLPGLDGNRS